MSPPIIVLDAYLAIKHFLYYKRKTIIRRCGSLENQRFTRYRETNFLIGRYPRSRLIEGKAEFLILPSFQISTSARPLAIEIKAQRTRFELARGDPTSFLVGSNASHFQACAVPGQATSAYESIRQQSASALSPVLAAPLVQRYSGVGNRIEYSNSIPVINAGIRLMKFWYLYISV